MTRTLIATTIYVAALLAAPALADDAPTLTVRDHRTQAVIVRDHRTAAPVIRDHRTSRPNEVVIVGQGAYNCLHGEVLLHRMGYEGIEAYDCEGAIYHYVAVDGSAVFRATMSSHSGEIRVDLIALTH